MSIWSEIRKQARQRHDQFSQLGTDMTPAENLLAAAGEGTGIQPQKLPANDALLDGADAIYHANHKCIYYSAATDPVLARFHIAHEYAHYWLDAATSVCRVGDGDIDLSTPAEPEMSLVGESDAYNPKERAEAQANLFAREFLSPGRSCVRGAATRAPTRFGSRLRWDSHLTLFCSNWPTHCYYPTKWIAKRPARR